MQNKLSFLILLSSIHVLASNCDPGDKSQCCEFVQSKNNTSVSRLETLDKASCTMSVYTQNTDHGYRRFGFASDGQVAIFLQPGGNTAKANSMTSYLIYPFNEKPALKSVSGDNIEIESGSGQTWTFDSKTSLPTQLEDCSLSVSPHFSLQNSGVKISSCSSHLVIEVPVEIGGEYTAYKGKPLTIKDPENKSCIVTTDDLFKYDEKPPVKDGKGRYFSYHLKFKTNHELGVALKKLCGGLDVSMLTSHAAPPPAAAIAAPLAAPSPAANEEHETDEEDTKSN